MSDKEIPSTDGNSMLRQVTFSLIVIALVISAITGILFREIVSNHSVTSSVLFYASTLTIVGYVSPALLIAAGAILLAKHRSFNVSRKKLFIAGSILLLLSFLPILLPFLIALLAIYGHSGFNLEEYGAFTIFYILLDLVIFTFSLSLIGLSLFKGHKAALILAGLVLPIPGTAMSVYMDYLTYFSSATGNQPVLSYSIASSYVIYDTAIQVLGVLSLICFIIAFGISIIFIRKKGTIIKATAR